MKKLLFIPLLILLFALAFISGIVAARYVTTVTVTGDLSLNVTRSDNTQYYTVYFHSFDDAGNDIIVDSLTIDRLSYNSEFVIS